MRHCEMSAYQRSGSYEEGVDHDLGFFYDVMVGRRTK